MVMSAAMDWTQAVLHLAKADPRLAPIIEKHGHPTMSPTTDAVQSLARAIVGQQLSGKAASTIWGRVLDLYPKRKFPTPAAILATPDTSLRAAGLSGAKAAAIKDLARHVVEAKLVPSRLPKLTDTEISALLLPVRGIGPWSVDMFLMFALDGGTIELTPEDREVIENLELLQNLDSAADLELLEEI